MERTRELRAAGFEPQVEDVPGLSLVFTRDEGIKRRLGLSEAGAARGIHTPNVLLRPIVEQAVLPTVAYVAGPGELAYFAQVSAVAGALELDAPLAVPRWSCTLLEPKVEALMADLGTTMEEVALPHALETRIARSAMGSETAGALDAVRASISAMPTTLGGEVGALGLDRAVQGATQSLLHRLERLERRIVAGVKRREVARLRDVATLRGALYPLGTKQERALNLIPLLARHGVELLAEMCDAAADHAQRLVRGDG
jgi:uncharacterized protein YllA (UPF0747 family)